MAMVRFFGKKLKYLFQKSMKLRADIHMVAFFDRMSAKTRKASYSGDPKNLDSV